MSVTVHVFKNYFKEKATSSDPCSDLNLELKLIILIKIKMHRFNLTHNYNYKSVISNLSSSLATIARGLQPLPTTTAHNS